MKKYEVSIKFITPYMQHRMDDNSLEAWEKMRGSIIENGTAHQPTEIRAMYHSYMDDKGQYLFPVEHIRQSCINAGGLMKAKVGNARKSMSNIVAAMYSFWPDFITIPKFNSVDSRSAVNKKVDARVMVHRPKWDDLEIVFNLRVDNDTITDETTQKIIEDAGNYIGAGSYRPQHKGSFGRFEIIRFERVKE